MKYKKLILETEQCMARKIRQASQKPLDCVVINNCTASIHFTYIHTILYLCL